MKPRPSATAVFEDYAEAFPEDSRVDGNGARVNPGIDSKRNRLVLEQLRRVTKQGWDNATIISVLPFPLDVNLGYGGHITMPPKKVGAAYTSLVLDRPYIDPQDEGDGKIVPIPVFPAEMAEDMVREYLQTGGVFWYVGDEPLNAFVDERTGKTGPQMLEEAMQAVMVWYEMLYKDAQDEWAREPRHRNITDRMRDAAKELYRSGIISALPEWTKVSKEESPNTNCSGCGQQLAKVAKFCPTCETIYDVAWVKEHRPDIFLKQNTSAVERFIKEEQDKIKMGKDLK